MTDPKIPVVIAQDVVAIRPEDTPDEFLQAIRERLTQPLSREQIVANELFSYIEVARPIAQWADEGWRHFARHMIQCVEVACDTSAEDMAKAMNEPPRHPLPTWDELDSEG